MRGGTKKTCSKRHVIQYTKTSISNDFHFGDGPRLSWKNPFPPNVFEIRCCVYLCSQMNRRTKEEEPQVVEVKKKKKGTAAHRKKKKIEK